MDNEKELKGTESLQKNLQSVLQKHGIKVSRRVAWGVFKDVIATTVATTLDEESMRLPLAGVGTFEIKVLPLRKTHFSSKEGESPRGKELTHNQTVKFIFRPSSKIISYLEQNIEGVLKTEPKEYVDIFVETLKPESPKPAGKLAGKPAGPAIEDF